MTPARPLKAIIGLVYKRLRELFFQLVPCGFHPVPQSLGALKPLFAEYGIGMTGLRLRRSSCGSLASKRSS